MQYARIFTVTDECDSVVAYKHDGIEFSASRHGVAWCRDIGLGRMSPCNWAPFNNLTALDCRHPLAALAKEQCTRLLCGMPAMLEWEEQSWMARMARAS